MLTYLIVGLVFYLAGFYTYHYILGTAGFFGRLVQHKVNKRLKKIGKLIIQPEIENDDPNLPGRRTRERYGKYGQNRKDSQ